MQHQDRMWVRVGRYLQEHCDATGTSAADFARLVGVSREAVRQWLSGQPISADRLPLVLEHATTIPPEVRRALSAIRYGVTAEQLPELFGVSHPSETTE